MINSYPKIYNLGHAAIVDLLKDPVIVEEKIDGSQFSFCIHEGVIQCRSKGAEVYVDHAEKMFQAAVDSVQSVASVLQPNWIYRGEVLSKPKHNILAYDRVPAKNIILFDITTGPETYLTYEDKKAEASRLGFETVPLVHQGMLTSVDELKEIMESISVLGGSKIEWVVVKNYKRFGIDGKVLLGKHVSERFKEVKGDEWSKNNPKNGDIIQFLGTKFQSEARWHKAIQHRKEVGELLEAPQDIGPLLKDIQKDIAEECVDEIKEALLKQALPHILRAAVRGFPEWYKEQLMKKQFGEE